MGNKKIPLFYWSERRFAKGEKENYGDLLSKYLVEKISNKNVKFVHPKKQSCLVFNKKNYLAIGSILQHASKDSIVWGSGIIDTKHTIAKARFNAVRGPKSREYLLAQGYECPEVYGDPALLLPEYFNPTVDKKFKLGIIPHYKDYEHAFTLFGSNPDIRVIDLLTLDVEKTTLEILKCENTISSSLHGLVVSHAYGIPSVWVEFSKEIFGDGVKYADYLLSLDLRVYKPEFISESKDLNTLMELIKEKPALPKRKRLQKIQQGLIENCPFIQKQGITST